MSDGYDSWVPGWSMLIDSGCPLADHPCPTLLPLPDGCLLLGDSSRLRKISADLQHVSTAGDGTHGHRAAAQAQFTFNQPTFKAELQAAWLPARRLLPPFQRASEARDRKQ